MKSRTLFSKLTSLTLTLTMLLAPFVMSVSAAPALNPLKEPDPPWSNDYVLDVLPVWAHQPPPPEPVESPYPISVPNSTQEAMEQTAPPSNLARRAVEETLALELSPSPYWESSAPVAPSRVLADVDMILDDGAPEGIVGIGGTWEFLWLNRFTPNPGDYPFELFEIQVAFLGGTSNVSVGDDIILVVYENTSGNTDPAVGSNWLASFATTVQAVDAWNVYDISATPVTFNGPGDVIIGVIALEVPGSAYSPAVLDTSTILQRSWLGWWSTSPPPTPPTLPPDTTWATIDDLGAPGTWLIRGYAQYLAGGWLEGYVMDSETGDVDPTCTDATVHIQPGGIEVPVDPTGYYWTPLISGTYAISATAPGYSFEGPFAVTITDSMTTTQDFNLWRPIITVTPGSLVSYTAYISRPVTYTLSISNSGHLSTSFRVREPGGTGVNFEGMNNVGFPTPFPNVAPPDTDGQVGPNHYVQIVNHGTTGAWVGVWDKAGNPLYDFGLGDLWPSGDPCHDYPRGDPVVLYDQLADRWLLTQFTDPPSGNYNECIAVSTGPVPSNIAGNWYLYTFDVHATKFNDYPKLGIWPDAYYMMAHQFDPSWAGSGFWAFDRASMLAGTPPQSPSVVDCIASTTYCVYHDLEGDNPNYGGMLPSNLMGSTPPPPGSPNYFIAVDRNWSGTDDIMTIWEVTATFGSGLGVSVVDELVVQDFTRPLDPANPYDESVHQPGTATRLEALADRLMMHAWYRHFPGEYEVIVVNHTVDATDGGHRAGIRWYEIRKDAGGMHWYIYQDGLYYPDDDHRWVGSIAMDSVGNIALGYSVSSETTYPSIRYAYRDAFDPLNWMGNETNIISGAGSQTGTSRWGDYSAMSVDPSNDCTFWYTTEYIETTGTAPWQSRIASFDIPGCLDALEWIEEDPINGTVPASSTVDIDLTVHCTETRDYTGTLFIYHDDPCQINPIEVPLNFHCQSPPPEPAWEKEVWVNGLLTATYPFAGPITVVPSDTVEIVERVYITYTSDVTFTLVETWTESLEAISIGPPSVGFVNSSPGWAAWYANSVAPNTWHVLTKTFHVADTAWLFDTVTETLTVEDADPQLDGRVVTFQHGCVPPTITDLQSSSPVTVGQAMYFTATVSGDVPIIYTWDFDSDGTPEQTGALTTTSHTYAAAGTYTVTLMVDNGCAPTDTDFIVVTVNPGPTYYTLTVATDGTGTGTVTPTVGTHSYLSGTVVPITATAGLNSTFDGWSGALSGSTNPTSITMDGHKVVTATFNLIPGVYYTLTVATDGTGTGTVTPTVGTHSYISGTTVWLTATADAGSTFDGWSGDAGGTTSPVSVTMDGNKAVTATFTVICIEVTSVNLTYTNTGTIYTDTVVYFSADVEPVNASAPYTYIAETDVGLYTGQMTTTVIPITFDDIFGITGTHAATITVWNCNMPPIYAISDTITFTVREQGVCVELDEITIAGDASGYPGVYTFTTDYEPFDASIPITYTWDDGGDEETSVRSLDVGTYTLMVTATNLCTVPPVTDTHEIVISSTGGYDIYLPVVLRNY